MQLSFWRVFFLENEQKPSADVKAKGLGIVKLYLQLLPSIRTNKSLLVFWWKLLSDSIFEIRWRRQKCSQLSFWRVFFWRTNEYRRRTSKLKGPYYTTTYLYIGWNYKPQFSRPRAKVHCFCTRKKQSYYYYGCFIADFGLNFISNNYFGDSNCWCKFICINHWFTKVIY